jgi:hypothetical protein
LFFASGIQYPASSIQYPASSIKYPVSSIKYPVSSIQHPVSSNQKKGVLLCQEVIQEEVAAALVAVRVKVWEWVAVKVNKGVAEVVWVAINRVSDPVVIVSVPVVVQKFRISKEHHVLK